MNFEEMVTSDCIQPGQVVEMSPDFRDCVKSSKPGRPQKVNKMYRVRQQAFQEKNNAHQDLQGESLMPKIIKGKEDYNDAEQILCSIVREFSCHICDLTFALKERLRDHIQSVHLKNPLKKRVQSVHENDSSNVSASHEKAEVENVPSTHDTKSTNQCHICNKMYSSKVSLKLHIKVIHDGIKKHKCQICNKAYRLSGELNRHVEIQHENIRNFECDICKRYFGMRAQLMSHIKTVHDKKRDFKCKECSAAFGTKGELNRHTKIIHNNIRDFVCTICNGAYGTRYQYYNTF